MSNRTFANATTCPWCGTETLERDLYRKDHEDFNRKPKPNQKPSFEFANPEYLCTLCGRGFAFTPSLRHQQAMKLFKEHRQIRQDRY